MSKFDKFVDLMDKVLFRNFNTTSRSGAIATVLIKICKNELYTFIVNVKEPTYLQYYGNIELDCKQLQILVNSLSKSEFVSFVGNYDSRDINFRNFVKLFDENLIELYSEFDTNFRGNIVKFHKFDGEVIIETESISEPDCFTLVKYYENVPKLDIHEFESLRDTYIYAKSEKHYDSIICLMNDKN